MSMRIKEITIRGMRKIDNATYSFEPGCNYMVGKNGTGKSTILNAIQLVILGHIPGQGKKHSDIMKNSNGKYLEVSCVLGTPGGDITLTRSWVANGSTVTGGKLQTSSELDEEFLKSATSLPIFDFNEFCAMSANSQKNYFIELVKDFSSSELDVMKEVLNRIDSLQIPDTWITDNRESLLCKIQRIWSAISAKSISESECIAEFNKELKSWMSLERESVNRSIKFVQELVKYDDVDEHLSESDVLKDIAAIQEDLNKVQSYEVAKARYDEATKQLCSYPEFADLTCLGEDTRFQDAEETEQGATDEISSIDTKLNQLEQECDQLQNKLHTYDSELASLATRINNPDICPYSQEPCSTIQQYVADATTKYDGVKSERDAVSQKLEAVLAARGALSTQRKSLVHKVYETTMVLDKLNRDWETYQQIKTDIGKCPAAPACLDKEQLNAQLDEAQTTLDKLRRNQVYDSLYESATRNKNNSEMTITVLKELIKFTGPNELQARSVNAGFQELKKSITKYLKEFSSEDIEANMNLKSTANSFSFGITRNDMYIPYSVLSTGEQCLYLLAFACAMFDYSSTPLHVILLDDALDHLDGGNIDNAFRAMKAMSGMQFICAGIINYKSSDVNIIDV